jgi:hypothetical protein
MRLNGWRSLSEAPHDRAVNLLFLQNGKPVVAVGRLAKGKWLVKIPHRPDETVEIFPRRFADIPPIPDFGF